MLALPTDNSLFLYAALGVIVVGNGLFKPNAGNLVRKIYEGDDASIDSAFTIYYMAVNIGSTVSMLADAVDATGHAYTMMGWHAAFARVLRGPACVGLVNYCFMRRSMAHIGSAAGRATVPGDVVCSIVLGAGIVLGVGVDVHPAEPGHRPRLRVLGRRRDARHLRLHDREESRATNAPASSPRWC